jgi:beta-aspartyl-peptidase (threonine type)
MKKKNQPVLVVHGGAWKIPDDEVVAHLNGIRAALQEGWKILKNSGKGIDAVERAVSVMEDDPTFDAGKGSILNTDGSIEMDASIMDGSNLRAGAVAALRNYPNPVQVARCVLEKTEHILLTGSGCESFAMKHGFHPVPIRELLTERELRRLESILLDEEFRAEHAFGQKRGTVGVVALDENGHIAAATSTGGTPKKIPGRVGDTPIIGAGTYAEDGAGGVSCTGWGEAIMKVMLAKDAADRMRQGVDAQSAADQSIALLHERVKGLGGLICIDPKGQIGISYNTPRMARGTMTCDQDDFWIAVE